MKLINIGFGNMISADRLIAIVSPDSAPIKRTVQEARDRNMLIDATYGRRTRAVIIMDSDHVVLSAILPETISGRMDSRSTEEEKTMSEKGILFVLTGPSGVGKGTVLEQVREHKSLFYSISATTRAPREGEQDGVHYHFMTREKFQQLVEEGGFWNMRSLVRIATAHRQHR